MGNRLSPGCCCGGCDLLDVTFDTTVETSWVAKFDHYNAADELQTPSVGDALGTFTEGEYLVSKTAFPIANWAIDLTQLIPITWWDIADNTLLIELVDADDNTRLSISATPNRDSTGYTDDNDLFFHQLRLTVAKFDASGTPQETDEIDLAGYGGAAGTPPNEFNFDLRGFGLIVRANNLEIGSKYDATGAALGDERTYLPVASDPSFYLNRYRTNTYKRHPLYFDESLPPCRLKISTLGDDLTFDALFAGRVQNLIFNSPGMGEYYSDANATVENPSCPDMATCPIVPPLCHVLWTVNSMSFTGLTTPTFLGRSFTGCNGTISYRGNQVLPVYTYDPMVSFSDSYDDMVPTRTYSAVITIVATEYDDDEIDLQVTVAFTTESKVDRSTSETVTNATPSGISRFNASGGTGYWYTWTTAAKAIQATVRVPKWVGLDFPPITLNGSEFTVIYGEYETSRDLYVIESATVSDPYDFGYYDITREDETYDIDGFSIAIGVAES